MTALPAPSNHPVFLLAEHLDMFLAAIEDLQACKPDMIPADPQRVGSQPRVSLLGYARQLQQLEMAAIAHVGRARLLTRELVRRDKRFAMLGGLFVGGTAPLDDAVHDMCDRDGNDFASGGDPLGYLRSRGIIDEETGALSEQTPLAVTEHFRLAGSIETGPLVELVSTFLNTIELHFDLFPDLMDVDHIVPNKGELVS